MTQRKGFITNIVDGVAWGGFMDGGTFDLPADDHSIGNEVWYGKAEEGNDFSHMYIVIQEEKARIYGVVETHAGLEIVSEFIIPCSGTLETPIFFQ